MLTDSLKIVRGHESIPSDISNLEKFDRDILLTMWKIFKTSRNAMPAGHRLENLFWRILGSDRLHTRLSGSRIACIFMMIQQGEEAFERENPKLRIPEYAQLFRPIVHRPSLEIPPTPPPSPIDPNVAGQGRQVAIGQSDIADSLHQAFPQAIPVRASPPGPPRVPPPSPATPCASPLLAALSPLSRQPITAPVPAPAPAQAKQQAKASPVKASPTRQERPPLVSSNSDNVTTTRTVHFSTSSIQSSRPPPTRPTSTTLSVVDEYPLSNHEQSPGGSAARHHHLASEHSASNASIADSNTSSTASRGAKKAAGKAAAKPTIGKKAKTKFVAGKKGAVRPALVRTKSGGLTTTTTTTTTVVEEEEPVLEEEVVVPEKAAPAVVLPKVLPKAEKGGKEKAGHHKAGKKKKEEVIEEIVEEVQEEMMVMGEDNDEFEDVVSVGASHAMVREHSGGGLKKNRKKGSSTKLAKKHRNTSANAGKAAPALGIAAILGGPGTEKRKQDEEPKPTVSIVEPDFRRKFQERNSNMKNARSHSTDSASGASGNTSSSEAGPSGTTRRKREKHAFLTSETETLTVKSHATVGLATPSSGVVVARKVQGQNLLVVGGAEIRGLSTIPPAVTTQIGFPTEGHTVPAPSTAAKKDQAQSASSGLSKMAGRTKSTLSLLIEDARRNSGKKGKGVKTSP